MSTVSPLAASPATQPLNILIVDDEPKACQNLKSMLSDYAGRKMNFTPFAHSVAEAEVLIQATHPDLVFFDIEMPGEDPLHFLHRTRPDFDVIFVTAYSQYAVEAFRVKAVDYLLKPVDPDDLASAMTRQQERASARLVQKNTVNYGDLAHYIQQQQGNRQILLRDMQHQEVVALKDLLYIEAMKSYCKVVFRAEGRQKTLLMSHSVTEYENMLPTDLFIRIHRSYLVNRMHIRKMERKEQAYVIMANGDSLPVSRRRYSDLLAFIDVKKQ